MREARGYLGAIPATLRALQARDEHPPALIAAFGIAHEPEIGQLAIEQSEVRAVHITRLKHDGSGKADLHPQKIMIGMPTGSPIMLGPINDGLGLAIAEGIEDALSIHAATGLGVWAAGSAAHLPSLADAVPAYVDCVTILADADQAGARGAYELARRLRMRGIDPDVVSSDLRRAAA